MIKNWHKFYFKNSKFLILFVVPFVLFINLNKIIKGKLIDNVDLSLFVVLFVLLLIAFSIPFWRLRQLQNRYGIGNFTDEDLQLNQKRKLDCKLKWDDLYNRIQIDPWFAKQKVMKDEGAILINTGWSIYGWGDEIRIIPDNPLEVTQSVTVQSGPKGFKSTVVDYGTNWENILRIKKILESDQ